MSTKRKVLLIEDEAAAAELICQCLPCLIFTSARSVRDAINAFRIDRFSAIVLDLNLTDTQGVRTVELVRSLVPDVPVVVITGMSAAAVPTATVISAGAQTVLRKPIEPEELREALIQVIAPREVNEAFAPVEKELKEIKEAADDRCHFMDSAVKDSEEGKVPRPRGSGNSGSVELHGPKRKGGIDGANSVTLIAMALIVFVAALQLFVLLPAHDRTAKRQKEIEAVLAEVAQHDAVMREARKREEINQAKLLVHQEVALKLLAARKSP